MKRFVAILMGLTMLVGSTAGASSLLGGVVNTVKDTTGTVVDTVKDTTGAVVDVVSDTTEGVVDTVKDVLGGTGDAVSNTVDTVQGTVGEVVGAVTDTVDEVLDTQGSTGVVDKVTGTAKDALDSLITGVNNTVGTTVDSLGNQITVLAPVTDTVKSTVDGVSGLLQDVLDWLLGTNGNGGNGGNNGGNNGNNGSNSGGTGNGGGLGGLIGSDTLDGQSLTDLYRRGLDALRAAGKDVPANADLFLGFGKDLSTVNEITGEVTAVITIALFDKEGHILDVNIDAITVASLEEAEAMDLEAAIVALKENGQSVLTPDGTWAAQVASYESLFRGRTVEEITDWFERYFSEESGLLLTAESTDATDAARYSALTDEEKSMLADISTSATIQLDTAHEKIVSSLEDAYTNRQALAE